MHIKNGFWVQSAVTGVYQRLIKIYPGDPMGYSHIATPGAPWDIAIYTYIYYIVLYIVIYRNYIEIM